MRENKLLVCVGQKDINNGQVCDAVYCPVAIALRRTVPWNIWGPAAVDVNIHALLINMVNYHIPRSVANFVRAFDRAQRVKPFKFWLRKEKKKRKKK